MPGARMGAVVAPEVGVLPGLGVRVGLGVARLAAPAVGARAGVAVGAG
ncbi:MAG: branched-chain amino acid ABC transporter permease, partial [Chloroflexi bacterium]|nr:branched-chain amino acid ABC transporter permease [Chloroflexota bacterium]